jgi:RNA polymerase Rpc34 subunit
VLQVEKGVALLATRTLWLHVRGLQRAEHSRGVQIDEQCVENGESVYVNLIMKQPGISPLSDVPCGMCPVIHECADGNDVSPANCQYMTAWLDF